MEMVKREGLVIAIAIFALTLPFTTWYRFYKIPVNVAVIETPMYLLTMGFPILIGLGLLYTNLWLGMLVIYSTLNVITRPNTLNMQSVEWFSYGCLMFEIVRLYVTDRMIYYIKIGFAFVGILESVYAIHQILGYDIIWFGWHKAFYYVHGTLGNPNYLAVFQVICSSVSPLCLSWFMLIGIILSKSYLGIMGFVIIMTVRLQNFWVTVYVSLIAFWVTIADLIDRFFFQHSFLWKFSMTERLAILWLGMSDVIRNAKWFGFGLGGWFIRSQELQSKSGLLKSFVEFYAQMHNEFAQFYYESGIVGLVILCGLLFKFRRSLIKAPVVGAILTSLGMFPFHLVAIAIPLILALGTTVRERKEINA